MTDESFEGRCTCGTVRLSMTSTPLFVHCRRCQRETGASFALNAMIEADRVQLIEGGVDMVHTLRKAVADKRSRDARAVAWRCGARIPGTRCVSCGSVR